MKKNKLISVFGFAALLATTLASCGGNPQIVFWHGFGAAVQVELTKTVSAYESDTGHTIVDETKGGYDNLYSAVQMSIGTQSFPHIALAYPDHMASYLASGIISPLDDLMVEAGIDPSKFVQSYMDENRGLANYTTGDRAGQKVTYGLPFNKSTEVFTINETFFDWITTVDATIKVPETWDEVYEVGTKIVTAMQSLDVFAKTIKGEDNKDVSIPGKLVLKSRTEPVEYAYVKAGDSYDNAKYVVVLDYGAVGRNVFRPFAYDSLPNMLITLVRQYGAVYTTQGKKGSNPDSSKGTYDFTTPENWAKVLPAFRLIQKMAIEGIFGIPNTWNGSYASDAFKLHKTVGVVGSSAGVYNNVIANNEIESYPIPYKDAEHKYVISQGTNLVMFMKGNRSESMKAIKYLTTGEGNLKFAMGTGYFPVETEARNTPEYKEYLDPTAVVPDKNEQSKRSAARLNAEVYLDEANQWKQFVDAGFKGSAQIRINMGLIIQNIFNYDYVGQGKTSSSPQAELDAIIIEAVKVGTKEIAEQYKHPQGQW